MKRKRGLKIFVGYQIESKFHDLDKLKEAIDKVKKKVEDKENVRIEVQYGEFPPGKFLFKEVLHAIKNCEISIFDISENCPNVLIEVGMAYGDYKRVVLLKNSLSKKDYCIPSDIGAPIYVPYKNNDAICEDNTCDQIADGILDYCKTIPRPIPYFKSLWGFNENDHVYIICPELPEPKKKQEPEPEEFLYLGKYGDIDSFMIVYTSLNKLYPRLKIDFCTSKEFKEYPGTSYQDNLILIGGPDYNKITEAFMKYTPFEFLEENETTILRNKLSNQRFKSNIERGIDYGFFFKIPNPSTNKKLIMINGIHTYGVYGAAKCFSLFDEQDIPSNNCKEVIEKWGDDPNFAIILETNIIDTRVMTPKINRKDLKIRVNP